MSTTIINGQTIDTHNPPPRSDAKAFLNFQIAVMAAKTWPPCGTWE